MMDCYCDYEMPAVYHPKLVKAARKEHTCDECFGKIRSGESYESAFGIWDGRGDTYKTCSRCLSLRDFITQNVKCFCWAHGNMIEDAMAEADAYHEIGNGLLFGAYRRKILIERAKQAAQC